MKLHDFPLFSSDIITFESSESTDSFNEQEEIQLFMDAGGWFANQGHVTVPVEPPLQESVLFSGLAYRQETIWLLRKKKGKKLHVQYLSPFQRISSSFDIGVDGLILDDLYSSGEISAPEAGLACDWLNRQFILEGSIARLAIARYPNTSTDSFQAIGLAWRAMIERENNGAFRLVRINRKAREAPQAIMLEGSFQFKDARVARQLEDPLHKELLEAALRENGSYLGLWKLYNDRQWSRAQQSASKLGALRYIEARCIENVGNYWHLTPASVDAMNEFRERWEALGLADSDQVEVTDRPPDWTVDIGDVQEQTRMLRGRLRFKKGIIEIQPDERRVAAPPSQAGWIYYSLAGERTVGKRREEAKRQIDRATRLPQLKFLLEGRSVPIERRRKLPDLTPYARESFKGGTPTERQRRALAVALNTPDIALVIGPPGTGKTQVIAALQRRLAEEFDRQELRGQVLISSYQHDAVDNALSRSGVYGLPAVRVGGRQDNDESVTSFTQWSINLAKHLDHQVLDLERENPTLGQLKELRRHFQLMRMNGYDNAGRFEALAKADELLKQVESPRIRVPDQIKSQWQDYLREQQGLSFKAPVRQEDRTLATRIWGLRTDPISFADDGPQRARDLFRLLKASGYPLTSVQTAVLDQVTAFKRPDDTIFPELERLRDQLLDNCVPDYRPTSIRTRLDNRGLELLGKIEQALEQCLVATRQGVAGVLDQLANAIKYDERQAHRAATEYAMVVGATCQQAASQKMVSLKATSDMASESITFDTVIIDEAARANPLDLFVPMAMAERRIILVGDDRQLPHLLEPDIEEDVAGQHELSEVQREAFKTSLFERLRIQLQSLEQKDQVQRVVMLDTQFRMHPVLGDFISKHFYEAAGLERVRSGKNAEDFVHGLPGYEGKVCAWLEVANDKGSEQRHNRSRRRLAEARAIATEAARLLEAGGEALSVGIITFYSAQRDLIMQQLTAMGIMESKGNSYIPVPAYRVTSDGEERLRVGTVDAFQGKEFDVVLLSNVRSSSRKVATSPDDSQRREDGLNAKYGFLRLENRMNVAMSRQRKLLIVVGDPAMAQGEEAQEAVPALMAFLKLCRGEHGCIRPSLS